MQTEQRVFNNIENTDQVKPKAVSFLELFRYADKIDAVLITIGLLSSVTIGVAYPAFAFITGETLDSYSSGPALLENAKRNLILYIGLGVISLILGTIMFYTWTIVGERQAIKCRRQYFKSILKQEIAWFQLNNHSAISTDFEMDSMTFQLAVGQKISTILTVLTMLVVGLGLSFYTGWVLTLVMLAYMPVLIIIWSKLIAIKVENMQKEDQIFRQSDAKAHQTLSSIKLVKQMNGEEFQCSIQQKILQNITKIFESTVAKFAAFCILSTMAIDLIFVLIYWYGSECIFDTQLCPNSINKKPYTAGSITIILYSLLLPSISLNQLSPCLKKIAEGKAAASRIFAIIDRVPLIRSMQNSVIPDNFKGYIEFRDVHFTYPKYTDKQILKGLNLKISCNHSALIAASGFGKSTIFQLIMRFYDPNEGAVYLDGVDLRTLNLQWLRSQIGYVTQQPVLFAASIKENLLLGKMQASDEQIQQALQKASALQFVNSLSKTTNTFVGSGGSQLSGGQKQRIAIARVLLKGCKLVLLDEATSALDRQNEKKILNVLKSIQQHCKTINITHRKRVLRDCDQIFQFQDGRLKRVIKAKSQNIEKKYSNSLIVPGKQATQLKTILPTQQDKNHSLRQQEKQIVIEEVSQGQLKQQQKKEQQVSSSYLLRFCKYCGNSKLLLLGGVLFSVLNGFAFPSLGIILAKLMFRWLKFQQGYPESINNVNIWFFIALAVSVFNTICKSLSIYFFGILGKNVVYDIRIEALNKVYRMSVSWFEDQDNSPEKITSQITQSCKTLYDFFKEFVPHIIIIATNIIFSLIGALIFEWRTGLTSFTLIPLILLAQMIQFRFVEGLIQTKNKMYSKSTQIVKQAVANIKTVLSLNATEAIYRRYELQLINILDSIKVQAFLSALMYGFSFFTQFLTFALIFFLSAVYISNFHLDIEGSLQAIFLIVFACYTAGNHSKSLPQLSAIKIASKKIFSIIDQQDQYQRHIKSGSQMLKLPIKGNIDFQHVQFKYSTRPQKVLDDFTLKIRNGEHVYILGQSGCGKSTLFGLLLRFYEPISGRILIEGIDIKQYDLQHLRGAFGIVSQQPSLFNETIAWNIRYNLKNISKDQIVRISRTASFDPNQQLLQQDLNVSNEPLASPKVMMSETQNDQFQKNVGPRGSYVSGGQKQRIAIARTILRQPSILLLDEVTSALDPRNESAVQSSLLKIMKGKTMLSITHRLEQIQNAERVIVISAGKIIEDGSYKYLSAQNQGYFCNIRESIRQSKIT